MYSYQIQCLHSETSTPYRLARHCRMRKGLVSGLFDCPLGVGVDCEGVKKEDWQRLLARPEVENLNEQENNNG